MTDRPVPPDQDARDRITQELDATLFVEAGAGSGKTAALVDRVLALVAVGRVELRAVAAITFTEKAGSELRDRIRRDLERQVERDPEGERGARCRLALDQLDAAAVGTLHSFAQRLLSEHPVEAGLPPRIDVLDEVSSGVAFERRWGVFRDDLLADPALERTILLLLAAGVRPEAMRSLAQAFSDNWDLVDERVPATAPEPPSVQHLLAPALDAVRAACAEPCLDPGDKLGLALAEICEQMDLLESLPEIDVLEALGQGKGPLASFRFGNVGKKGAFACDPADLRARVREAGARVAAVRATVADACAASLGSAIRRFTLEAAHERRRTGQLEFHDLLVLARSLLRDPAHGGAVRTRLHERYQRLLLDEFQDTDPIQIELAVRLAAAEPGARTSGEAPWEEIVVEGGRLFVVGDPKQSIYRFRRADITTFLAAERRFGGDAGGLVALTANFRSVEPVIDWVNATFAGLMGAPGGNGADRSNGTTPTASAPPFVALAATRRLNGEGPGVAVLGRQAHPAQTTADDLRRAEADEVAATVARALGEGWSVEDREGWRPARLGDMSILVPARTSLPFLEEALERAGIAFRSESSSLVYASREVRDLLMVLRAVDDPSNRLHLVAALRTPLLACGDDDLFRFRRERRGHWNYLADQPESVPEGDPVRDALAYLRSLHELRHWSAPSELLDRIARDRRALELGFAQGRPRDVWRRIRFVVDQARAWAEATGGNLRQYLHWVHGQSAEGVRVNEAVLPETDDDAVRIMTIHAAKGLEFPITIVSGMSTRPSGQRAPAQVVFPPGNRVGYRFGSSVATREFVDWKPIDEQMDDDERVRLLYVACTRARDHLVVSLHRKERRQEAASPSRTNAEVLVEGMGDLVDDLPDGAGATGASPVVTAARPSPPPPLRRWFEERSAALLRASRRTAVAATALTDEGAPDPGAEPDPGLQKRPRDLDLPPWVKGRYGTSVGRAVHGVLQTIDLATAAGLDAAVAAQCEAEAVPERAADVRALVSSALASRSVREAAGSPHWREVYACTPVAGRLLEGYVDLLYRSGGGLVVVDYKTASTSDPEALAERVLGYRNQGASYALAVGAASGEAVTRVTFVFLTPDGAAERDLPDLTGAVAHVRALVAAGDEVTVD